MRQFIIICIIFAFANAMLLKDPARANQHKFMAETGFILDNMLESWFDSDGSKFKAGIQAIEESEEAERVRLTALEEERIKNEKLEEVARLAALEEEKIENERLEEVARIAEEERQVEIARLAAIEAQRIEDEKAVRNGTVALKSYHGKYLVAYSNGAAEWNRDHADIWE
jgi:hypothetical protein